MKTLGSLTAISLVSVLLTWLLLKGMNTDSRHFEEVMNLLDNFRLAESTLHRDVLAARVGLLRNYDPLVQEIRAERGALQELRQVTSSDAEEVASIDRLRALADRQEELTEKFKSNNALLQNSLAYFVLFSGQLSASPQQEPPAIGALVSTMLNFTLNTSPSVADEVRSKLDAVAKQSISPGDAQSTETLLAHGRLLHGLLPATDNLLRELLSVPSQREEVNLRTLFVARHDAARERAGQFRLLLYATSLLLLVFLVYLGLRLKSRAEILGRRAAFEHLLAGISTRFINCQSHQIGSQVEQALAVLGEHIGADRAYYLHPGITSHMHVWARAGEGFPPGWRDEILSLSAGVAAEAGAVVHYPDVGRLPAGPVRNRLKRIGVAAWICLARTDGDGGRSILGFDQRRSHAAMRSSDLGLLRIALDAIANAVGRIALEQERERLEARLQHARRMETVGSFASGIAHNFNNIIGAILGYTEIVEAQITDVGQAASNLNEIRKAGERARDLVEEILAFGRSRDGHRRSVSISQLMDETSALLRVSLPPAVELVLHDIAEPVTVLGEPAQLQQVIINFCNNAAHAMDGSGRIEVDTQIHEIPWVQPLTHGDLVQGLYVCISVSDSGHGMSEAVLARIFEPFFTTRPEGNGLGLATVREIIRQHGGAINVRSTAGIGSHFEAWLPCARVTEKAPTDIVSSLPFGRGETLLVVSEDRDRLLNDEDVLAALSYEPRGYFLADEALQACRAEPERFDGLVLGYFASTSAALNLAAECHKVARHLPILLTTSSMHEVDASLLMAAGISEVVRRPLISAEVAAALKRCLGRSRFSGQKASRNVLPSEKHANPDI